MLPPSATAISRLLEPLSGLEDPRQQSQSPLPTPRNFAIRFSQQSSRGRRYSGNGALGKAERGFLRRYYPYARGFPNHDTVSDVFNALNAPLFSELFIRWTIGKGRRAHKHVGRTHT